MSEDAPKKDRTKSVKQIAALGGHARAKLLSPEERSESARLAAERRWEKKGDRLPRALKEGELTLGGVVIRCAVLEDGTRLLTQSDFMRALGRARQAKGRAYYDGDVNLPAFLTAKNLRPFIPKDLEVTSSQIEFRRLKGGRAFGYRAELLPKVCDVFVEVEEKITPAKSQEHIIARAKILMRGLAHVGIVALVDEATGYQDVRDRQALQEILEMYLRKEFAVWARTFPEEFYRQIYKLRNWEWKGMRVNRPQIVAQYTKDIVYSRLAPGLLAELEKRNPIEEGRRRAKHYFWLTESVGHPALAQHLYGVIGLMRISQNWVEFKANLDKAYPKKEGVEQFILDLS